jgi:hypothetical protein
VFAASTHSALFPKYRCVENWDMNPILRLVLEQHANKPTILSALNALVFPLEKSNVAFIEVFKTKYG